MNNNTLLSYFLVLLYVLFYTTTSGTTIVGITKSDSLKQVVNTSSGADKVVAQLELAQLLISSDKDEALSLAMSAYSGAKAIGNKKLEMRSYFILGSVYTEQSNYRLSNSYLDTALYLATDLKDSWNKSKILFRIGVNMFRTGEGIQALKLFNNAILEARSSNNYKSMASAYSMMGSIFRVNGFYDRAIEYIIKAKLNYEKANYEEGNAWSAYLLGRIYLDLNDAEKALVNVREALKVYHKLAAVDGNKSGLAMCYEQLGLIYVELGNFEEARKNVEQSRIIQSENKSVYGMSNVYKDLGRIEYLTGNYTKAEEYLGNALQIKIDENDLLTLPVTYEYLGLSQVKQGQVDEGFKTVKQGLDLAVSNHQRRIELDIYSKLSEAYFGLNRLNEAIKYQKKQIQLQDSLLSGNTNIKLEQLQTIYEIDEKTKQIEELEKENKIQSLNIKQNKIIWFFLIWGIIIIILILMIVILFNKQIHHKNRELKEANVAKDKLFALIGHDLRGPTSALAGLLEYLNSSFDEFSTEELKELLFTVYKSAKNVSDLLENLLLWAKSQVSGIKCRPKEFALSDVLRSAVEGFFQAATNKEINIRFELKEQLTVFADPDMVQTIVRNAVSNAIKFTHRGGEVCIVSDIKNKKAALISIVDNGVGIDKDTLDKLLDTNSNIHTKGTENEESTGLGLILIADFVEKNNGKLSIESEKDKGTTVSFTLPLK